VDNSKNFYDLQAKIANILGLTDGKKIHRMAAFLRVAN
jgi:hypothetical protein